MKKSITVIGSSNTDLVVQTPSFPKPGETIMGDAFNTFAGGKGANQAVAAARLGGDVSFIAKVGQDDFGDAAIKGFENDHINTKFIYRDETQPSGVAIIMIDSSGENVIVVSPGANNELKPDDIDMASEAIVQTDMVLVQLEIPIETVSRVLYLATEKGKKVVLNPAPASILEDDLFTMIYVITPNETEVELLTSIKVTDEASASRAASVLLKKGVQNVLITLGEKGAFFKNDIEEFLVPTTEVEVIDTTGAGDTFNGALTVALSEGKSWREAIAFANSAAGISVSRLGAQASVPYKKEL